MTELDRRNALFVLGLKPGATRKEIKDAYHVLSLANHPDKCREDDRADAEIRFKSIKEAYEFLTETSSSPLSSNSSLSIPSSPMSNRPELSPQTGYSYNLPSRHEAIMSDLMSTLGKGELKK